LFYEGGKTLKMEGGKPWKDPRNPMNEPVPKAFDSYLPISNFVLKILGGERAVWNIIGNETNGNTFGISGILYTTLPSTIPLGVQAQQSTVTMSSLGAFRKYNAGKLSETTKATGSFITTYKENYLVLYNPGVAAISYSLNSTELFTLPSTKVIASGKVMNSIINLQMTEDKSRLYDILKYSLFVPE
jgi:hypothetical protein